MGYKRVLRAQHRIPAEWRSRSSSETQPVCGRYCTYWDDTLELYRDSSWSSAEITFKHEYGIFVCLPTCSLQSARRDGPHKNSFDALCLGGRLKTSLQPRFIGLHSTTSLPRNTIHTVHCLSLRQHGIVHRSQRVVQAALSSPSKPMSGCHPWLAVWCGAQVSTVWLYNRRGLGHGHYSGCSLTPSSCSVHRCFGVRNPPFVHFSPSLAAFGSLLSQTLASCLLVVLLRKNIDLLQDIAQALNLIFLTSSSLRSSTAHHVQAQ